MFGVRYHDTIVARWHRSDVLQLNTGGWYTSTTAIRIRAVLPPGIYLRIERGSWFLEDNRPQFLPGRNRVPFTEGMLIAPERQLAILETQS